MQELIKKQTEEVKAINPEAGVINAVIMPTETGSQLFVSILANASDVAEIINSIFEQHPQVREALGGIIMAKSMAVMMQHHDKYLENESEGFIEVN